MDAHPSYAALVDRLPISGASIAVFNVAGQQSTVWASDTTAARIEELQFDLGEGPHWRALTSAMPVLVSDTRSDLHPDWPLFSAAIAELRIGAIFAFPLLLGAITVGVVDLYRTRPGVLSQQEYVLAIALCGRVTKHAVFDAIQNADQESVDELGGAPAMRREVHQATGVVLVQLGVTATEAFFVLRAYAYSNGFTVLSTAQEVLAGRLDFSNLPD